MDKTPKVGHLISTPGKTIDTKTRFDEPCGVRDLHPETACPARFSIIVLGRGHRHGYGLVDFVLRGAMHRSKCFVTFP
jgi:hypothetical protein